MWLHGGARVDRRGDRFRCATMALSTPVSGAHMAEVFRISGDSATALRGLQQGRLRFKDLQAPGQERAFDQFLERLGRPNQRLNEAMEALRREAEAAAPTALSRPWSRWIIRARRLDLLVASRDAAKPVPVFVGPGHSFRGAGRQHILQGGSTGAHHKRAVADLKVQRAARAQAELRHQRLGEAHCRAVTPLSDSHSHHGYLKSVKGFQMNIQNI